MKIKLSRAPRYQTRFIGLALCTFWHSLAKQTSKGVPPVVLEWVSSTYDPDRPQTFSTPTLIENATILSVVGFLFALVGFLGILSLGRALTLVHVNVKCLLWALEGVVFPPHLKWKASAPAIDTLFTALSMLNCFCELFCFPNSKNSRKIRQLLPPSERIAFLKHFRGSKMKRMWMLSFFVARQLIALDMRHAYAAALKQPDVPSADFSGMYFWGGDHLDYVGKFKCQRETQREPRAGCVARYLEHQTLVRQPQHRDGNRYKYKLGRQSTVDRHVFVVCRIDTHDKIGAMETLAINSTDPNGNEKKKKKRKQSSTSYRTLYATRRRLGQHARRKYYLDRLGTPVNSYSGPLDTASAQSYVQKYRAPDQEVRKLNQAAEKQAWDLPYLQACTRRQKRIFQNTGRIGPLDLYSPHHRPLLVQWGVKEGVDINWKRLDQKWGTSDSPLEVLGLSAKLGEVTRRRLITRKINTALVLRGLPQSGCTILRVQDHAHIPVIRERLYSILKDTPRLSPKAKKWMLGRTRVVVGAGRTLRWCRNGSR